MLTPQEVADHAFAKSAFGGYNMTMVDEFLDELTDDYTALYKENAALKAKMKVLVDKGTCSPRRTVAAFCFSTPRRWRALPAGSAPLPVPIPCAA